MSSKKNCFLHDVPKLIDCYGNYHDYKIESFANNHCIKLHNKKLNIIKNINRQKLILKNEKNNLFQIKQQYKLEKKSEIKAVGSEIKILIRSLKQEIYEINNFISFKKIVNYEINKYKKEFNKNYHKTKKTLSSLHNSDDTKTEISQKILVIGNKSLKVEENLKIKLNFLESLYSLSFYHQKADYFKKVNYENLDKQIKMFLSLDNYLNVYKDYLLKTFLFQKYLILKNDEKKDLIFKINKNIKNALNEKNIKINNLKIDYKNKLKNKKKNILYNYQNEKKFQKNNFIKYQNDLKKLKKENLFFKKEEKNKVNLINKKIKQIKKQTNDQYSFFQNNLIDQYNLKNLYPFSKIVFSYSLWNLFFWKRKLYWNVIKAKKLISFGTEAKELSYEAQYAYYFGLSLEKYNENVANQCQLFLDKIEKTKKYLKPTDIAEEALIKEKIKERKKVFKNNIKNFKIDYKNKIISKKAYKNAFIKEDVYCEEDIKLIKLSSNKYYNKYYLKDLKIQFKNNVSLARKEYLQDVNDIRKKTPIEIKRNSAYWKTLLSFVLPGTNDFINKNWIKALLMLLVSILVYAFLIPYGFGVYNIEGKGVIGLIQLSYPVNSNPVIGNVYVDSRYTLVEGVIALFMLLLSFTYMTSSAIVTWKIARSQELGMRANNWSETKKILRNQGFPYAISLPGWILIILIVIVPILVSILLAFTNIGNGFNPSAGEQTNWTGIAQFQRLFNDPNFLKPLGQVFAWNIIWAISSTLVTILLGVIMAVLIEKKGIKGKIFWRTIFILPWAIPAFVSILFFKVIFDNSSSGFINDLLINSKIINQPIQWTTNIFYARMILILIQGWLGHSYIILLFSGYMKAIPNDIYEAAAIDGAKPTKQFWKLTIPIILISVAPLLIGQFTFNFNNFGLIFLFNNGGGNLNPEFVYSVGNTDILLSWIFKITFTAEGNSIISNQALASTMIIVMSLIIITASAFSFSRTKAFKRGETNIK